uniref:Uncharacterized protein n=1 Tax=Myripristis murdjan TaxID=586833 RepID=A0A667YB21_9TELE
MHHGWKQLQQRASEIQEQTDSQRGALQTYMDQQSCVLLQKNNLLSQLQTQLDQTCSEVLRWVPGTVLCVRVIRARNRGRGGCDC